MLFSGSLRFNLDPFEEFEDEYLWKALNQVCHQNLVIKRAVKVVLVDVCSIQIKVTLCW